MCDPTLEYLDQLTGVCHPCRDLCDPRYRTAHDCTQHCPDFIWEIPKSPPTINPTTATDIMSTLTAPKYDPFIDSLVVVISATLIIFLSTVIALMIVKHRSHSKKRRPNSRKAELKHHSLSPDHTFIQVNPLLNTEQESLKISIQETKINTEHNQTDEMAFSTEHCVNGRGQLEGNTYGYHLASDSSLVSADDVTDQEESCSFLSDTCS